MTKEEAEEKRLQKIEEAKKSFCPLIKDFCNLKCRFFEAPYVEKEDEVPDHHQKKMVANYAVEEARCLIQDVIKKWLLGEIYPLHYTYTTQL